MHHVKGKVIIKVDVEQKNNYTFSNGTTIKMERDVENLDRKYTSQVLGEVVDAEYIPTGSMVLFHHNALHDVNVVFDSDYLTKEEQLAGFKVISISESDCFLWNNNGEWTPLKNFCTALRVFKPYTGMMQGIEPTIIKDCLYLTSGEYKGMVAHTLKACDYQITFRNEKGKDESFIRCRHFEDDDNEREELICLNHGMTNQVKKGELFIGLTASDCKALN